MQYSFPRIEFIDHVLWAIKDMPEFSVNQKDDYVVVNYNVAFTDTFKLDKQTPASLQASALRRECRGLIFKQSTGELISRPYHKFFNLGEREETQLQAINFDQPHFVMEKTDGSMIRLIETNGDYRLATKAGVTDTSELAEKYINEYQLEFMIDQYREGKTVLLEFVAPDNRIVVDYPEPAFYLTAIRDNVSGVYLPLVGSQFFEKPKLFMGVTQDNDANSLVENVVNKKNEEGVVIRFDDGHMVKLKNSWYLRIHKAKELILFDHKLAELILEQKIDDILPELDEKDVARVHRVTDELNNGWISASDRITELLKVAMTKFEGNPKRVALELVPKLKKAKDASFIFRLMKGGYVMEEVMNHMKKNVGTSTQYKDLLEWLN
jgi:RNA ligase